MGIVLGRRPKKILFRLRTDEESAQTIISGMENFIFDVLVDRMRREFNVEAQANLKWPIGKQSKNRLSKNLNLSDSREVEVSMAMFILE